MNRVWMCILAVLATGALAAGCSSEETDVSEGIDDLNQQIADQGLNAKVECPDKVDGGEGTTFDCTVESEDGKTSAPLKMKIVEEGGDLAVVWEDDAQYQKALEKVAGAQQ